MKTELPMIPLFELFVNDNFQGKRLKKNGEKIKPGTARNYLNTLKLLRSFERDSGFCLRINSSMSKARSLVLSEQLYWKSFFEEFSNFLYARKKCYDNYVGSIMKTIRAFLHYLEIEKGFPLEIYQKNLYVRKEEVEILTLDIDQLNFLINDEVFHRNLAPHLKSTKNLFVFGCTTALRYSDLRNIRVRDISTLNGKFYLHVKSQKTQIVSKIKLPLYALTLIRSFADGKKSGERLFSTPCLRQFNKNLQAICEKAGWTHILGKQRLKNGQSMEIPNGNAANGQFRFCDLVSSHIMRRSAITNMLMSGVPESVVRQISGHSSASVAFYRYIKFTQPYLDQQTDRLHKLFSKYNSV